MSKMVILSVSLLFSKMSKLSLKQKGKKGILDFCQE